MKIGIHSPYLDSLSGGERYMLTMAEYLSKNHSVDIFWDNKTLKKKIFERLSLDISKTRFIDNIFSSKKNLLKKLILTRKYDLIIFLSDGSIPLSLAKKNILHFQQPFVNINGKSLMNKLRLRRFQTIICNSKFTKQYIDKVYEVNSQVVYPPVDIEKFSSGKKKNLIFSVGRFTTHLFNKKQKEMIQIFQKALPQFKEWKLILAGGFLDQDKEHFKEVRKSIIKKKSIQLLTNISFEKIKKHYLEAKIYWHAMGFNEDKQKTPMAMEHFGMTTVEAMAAGCVPIVFDGGGQKEIIKHGENGFLWKNEKELIDYTLKIVNDNSLREKMSREAIKRSRDFSKEKFCQKIDRLIS